jgi:hypothetical protein
LKLQRCGLIGHGAATRLDVRMETPCNLFNRRPVLTGLRFYRQAQEGKTVNDHEANNSPTFLKELVPESILAASVIRQDAQ